MTTIDDVIRRVRELDAEATPAPWAGRNERYVIVPGSNGGASWPPSKGTIATLGDGEYTCNPRASADTALIAEYRSAAPLLADEVTRLRDALQRIRLRADQTEPMSPVQTAQALHAIDELAREALGGAT